MTEGKRGEAELLNLDCAEEYKGDEIYRDVKPRLELAELRYSFHMW